MKETRSRSARAALLALAVAAFGAACGPVSGTGGDAALPVNSADAGNDAAVLDGARDAAADSGSGWDSTAADAATGTDADVDAAAADVSTARDAAAVDTTPASEPPARYGTGRTQSPITPRVAAALRAIVEQDADQQPDVFAKIGDSITESTSFMRCFAGSNVDLAGHDELAATIDHFKVQVAGGTTAYDRDSLSAVSGWRAAQALAGAPSPLQQEVDAIDPRFALVMYGTNDIGVRDIFGYADNMLDLVDILAGQGVIPILSTIPPRDDDVASDLWVPHYNLVVRAVAQARQVPLVDLHRELLPLPGHGMAGDGVHLDTYDTAAGYRACNFGTDGLQHGYNMRNWLTINALDRVKRVVVAAAPVPDSPPAPLAGSGAPGDPIVIDRLPFVAVGDTSASPWDAIDSYPGCNSAADESGPEIVYRLVVDRSLRVRAAVYDRGLVDVDIHLLGDQVSGNTCLARAHRSLTVDLTPGSYHLLVDSFVDGGSVLAGEYLLTVIEDNGAQ